MNFDISGVKIFFHIPTHLPLIGNIVTSGTVVVSQLVILIIAGLRIFLTRDLKVGHIGKRQTPAELIVESAESLMRNNTNGNKFSYLIPFVGALFPASVISNPISLARLGGLTAGLSVEVAQAVTVFTMITLDKIKTGGLLSYPKDFTTPIPVMTPLNVPSEVTAPIDMACRHFGNVLSGVVINGLIYTALGVASVALFRLILGAVGDLLSHTPALVVGPPVIMSLYSDWFSGIAQAFILTMLTITYIANAPEG